MQKSLIYSLFLLLNLLVVEAYAQRTVKEETIRVVFNGEVEFKLFEKGQEFSFVTSDKNRVTVKVEEKQIIAMSSNSKEKLIGKVSDNRLEIYNGDKMISRFKLDGEKVKYYDSKGTQLQRLKLKKDKFNIYDGKDERILKGKPKDHGFNVYDAKGKRKFKIKGRIGMLEAAVLSLDIPLKEKAIAWYFLIVKL